MKKILLGIAALLLLDCGGQSQNNSGAATNGGPNTGQPTSVSTNYSTSMGGFLQNSEMSLSVLPGALPSDAVITAVPVKNPAPIGDPNVVAVSTVYEFGPDGSNFDFAHKPVMTFKVDPNKVSEMGGDPSSLSIAWFDAERGVYVGEGGTIDPATNTIRARVEHFTQYLVIALTQVAANNNHALVGAASFVPATPVAAAPIYVRQTVRDTTNLNPISSVRLYYKIGTAAGPLTKFVPMNIDAAIPSSPERYAGIIPADDVTTAGIRYEIRAVNSFGNTVSGGSNTINISRTLCSVNIPSIGANNNQITVGFNRQFTLSGQAAVTCPFAPVVVPTLIPETATVSGGIGTVTSVGSNGHLFNATHPGTSTINFSFGTVAPFAAAINQTVIAGTVASLQILDSNLLPIQGTLGITTGTNYQFNLRALDAFGNEYGAVVATSWDATGGIGSFATLTGGLLNTGAAAPGTSGTVVARIGGYGPPLYIGAVSSTPVNIQIFSGPFYTYLGGTDASSAATSVATTTDGGTIITGVSASSQNVIGALTALNPPAGGNDGIVMKLDANGAPQWFTYLGGTGNELFYSLKQTSDGGYVLCGQATSGFTTLAGITPRYPHSGSTIAESIVVKLSAAGAVEWWTFLGFAGTTTQGSAYDIIETADNGFAAVAFIGPHSIAAPGAPLLNSLYGIPITGGYWLDMTSHEAYMVKFNSSGYIQWWRSLANDIQTADFPRRIVQSSAGDFVIAGYAYGPFGPAAAGNGASEPNVAVLNYFHGSQEIEDITLTKVKHDGSALLWVNYLGGTERDIATSLAIAPDGGYVIGGLSRGPAANLTLPLNPHSGAGNYDFMIIKTNASGDVLWHTFFGGNLEDRLNDLKITKDGGFVVAGSSASSVASVAGLVPNFGLYNSGSQDGLAVKYDGNGALQWYEFLGANPSDDLTSLTVGHDGSITVAGSSQGPDVLNFLGAGNLINAYSAGPGISQMMVVKLRSNGSF